MSMQPPPRADAEHEPRVLVPAALDVLARSPLRSGRLAQFGGETMGTTWSVSGVLPADRESGRPDEAIDAAIRAVLDDVVAQMSNWRADSDISRFNQASAASWVDMPASCFDVVEAALAVARESGGAYDPGAGALVDLWGFGPAPRRDSAPDVDAIVAARRRCGWQRVRMDRARRRLYQPGSHSLDLCAIAKGYAVDAVSETLASRGIAHSLVEIGGELRGEGVKPDGLPWWVDLETPPSETEGPGLPVTDRIALHGLSVATSGDYRRFFFDAGERRSHTIDPRTGYPAGHGLASVTVLHRRCMLADAWSTALTVLGPDAGLALAQRKGLAARFVVRSAPGFREVLSPAYAALLA